MGHKTIQFESKRHKIKTILDDFPHYKLLSVLDWSHLGDLTKSDDKIPDMDTIFRDTNTDVISYRIRNKILTTQIELSTGKQYVLTFKL
ncbi:hypothetical protein SAMN04488691_105116 [Haloferax larsenii]|uniref:Uncharacterized protein n=1 Tax=Haloferax larsenii TaxID=302484 RepID=A0A1H7QR57_HALLR|nr:hypothetical protein SAMN04488691_105116 [Haloferax larsenii]